MSSYVWYIPIAYVLYLIALKIQNTIFIANDKPVEAINYMNDVWVIVLVFVFTLLLDIAIIVFKKWVEDW